jgi:hypothetical protein
MPILVSMADVTSVLEDPAWIMFGLGAIIGLAGLAALVLLYPFSRD